MRNVLQSKLPSRLCTKKLFTGGQFLTFHTNLTAILFSKYCDRTVKKTAVNLQTRFQTWLTCVAGVETGGGEGKRVGGTGERRNFAIPSHKKRKIPSVFPLSHFFFTRFFSPPPPVSLPFSYLAHKQHTS